MKTKSIYRNLVAEMARKGVTTQDLADAMGCVRETVSRKITGKTKITLEEAFLIRDTLFPNLGIEMLFTRKEDALND